MSTKEKLLVLLEREPGTYISGEKLADEIGVSRNAVWKAARALRNEGYLIDAGTNRGYSLRFGSDRLSPTGIFKHLKHENDLSISVRRTVDSTNTWVRQRAQEGAAEGTVVVAEGQTAGRGRRGRAFFSPEGSGIYLSLLLRPSIDPSQAHLLTCAAAVAVARAIERTSGQSASIKWVNDVYCNERKVAGILTEGHTASRMRVSNTPSSESASTCASRRLAGRKISPNARARSSRDAIVRRCAVVWQRRFSTNSGNSTRRYRTTPSRPTTATAVSSSAKR